jgi:uncharacterized caspase-like protein
VRKVAFLVGNDTFPKDSSIPPLRFTQNDARELAEVLEDRETCGFETRLYLNRPSQEVLTDLDQISGELGQDDTLLFYYSGHGKLRGNELCLVSNETIITSLGATSIRARLVLEYLQGSLARRRILILDCCYSGAIASIYRAASSKSAVDGLAHSFSSYILTASTSIELAEEREKDGHGFFTKALIDCLREGPKESVTVDDWYEYAYRRLKVVANQTPLKWGLQEGPSFEIGNFKAKHERQRQLERERLERERQSERERLERERQLERERLISTARVRLGAYVALGELTEEHVEEAVALLKRDEARLFPRDRMYRDDLIRFSKGEASFLEVFGEGHILRSEPAPEPPEDEVSPPITSPEAPVVNAPLTLSEPTAIDQPVPPPEPAVAAAPIPPEPPALDQPVTPRRLTMRKVAFLVANGTFPNDSSIPPLRFTQNDATDLAEILGDKDTCGFETKPYLNELSSSILGDFEETTLELTKDDTILFYYSGHGIMSPENDLCLASKETKRSRLSATSIEAERVLKFLQRSHAKRRVLILDCCHSGAIGSIFKRGDTDSSLAALAHSFGTYILTASTAIQKAEEREKEEGNENRKGNGVFTKALIDCLREGTNETVTVVDLYQYAFKRLRESSTQTPRILGEQEGLPIKIGDFRQRLARSRQHELEQLISTARDKFMPYVGLGDLSEADVEEAVALLQRDEAKLNPRNRRYRDDIVRCLKGQMRVLSVFWVEHSLRSELDQKPPENEVSPPVTPPKAPGVKTPLTLYEPPAVDQPVTPPEPAVAPAPIPPEPPAVDQPVTPPEPAVAPAPIPPEPSIFDPPVMPSAPEVMPSMDGGGELSEAKKSIFAFSTKKALFIISLLAISGLIIAFFAITPRSQSPSAFPLQADIINSKDPLQVKVLGAIYTVADRKLQVDLKISNLGRWPVRLGEFQSAGVRFLNPDVYTTKTKYPENFVADHGLSLSDNAPIAPGETRDITIIVQDDRQSDRLSYDVNKSPPSLLYFFTASGERYEVDIGGFVRPRS